MSHAELLQQHGEDQQTAHHADMILQAAQHSADLVAQLLAFSRQGKYRITRVDVHALVADVVLLLNRTVDRRIVIEQHLKANPSVTMGDESLLQSAILNLTINARDAILEGGTLEISTAVVALDEEFCRVHPHDTVPGEFLLLSVHDNGSGMDQETQNHIFEPFFAAKGSGTGDLGLAAVYGTVGSHGGTLEVESAPGCGSVFRVYLPLAPAEELPETTVPPKRPAASSMRTTTHILFADDEKCIRLPSSEALRNKGYEVVLCEDGAEAVECYTTSWADVDLVILDLMMPKMDGHDAFRAIRAINPDAKVLLLSGFGLDSRIQAVLDEGAIDFLKKPFRLSALYEKVEKALGVDSPRAQDGGS
ncbi:MAG: response regulator [Lentisphaerae bacterium]|jgi:CheY-like chemotaxis protein|nr:response regulator [Lentisphaerota bacterium]MBT4819267.1 response regulator [Lentisphaerota bacterium]MBT5612171.1 response regulator [Lentisphaerota bacterium]MBT7061098.1 response regulator [Lentisphaerota bacterium]MBT7843427.1 response regulator [Lentisphaerota bacterium]